MYELSEEEQALFGVVAEGTGAKPKDLDVISQDQAEADALAADGHTEEAKQILSEAPALAADGHYDGCPKGLKGQGCTCANRDALPDVSIPAPVASGPTPQVRTDAELLAADRAQPSTVGKLGANAAEQCATCPHPAHPGAQCTGKRGRGQCRCGVQAAAEREQDAPAPKTDHLPVCVQADGGKWLCMDGCTAGQVVGDPGPKPGTGIPLDAAEFGELPPVPSLQEGVRRHLAAQLTPPSPTPPEPRPALRLEIEFGPRAATILEKLAPALIELLKSKAGVL